MFSLKKILPICIVVLLLASCSKKQCIEADDFGEWDVDTITIGAQKDVCGFHYADKSGDDDVLRCLGYLADEQGTYSKAIKMQNVKWPKKCNGNEQDREDGNCDDYAEATECTATLKESDATYATVGEWLGLDAVEKKAKLSDTESVSFYGCGTSDNPKIQHLKMMYDAGVVRCINRCKKDLESAAPTFDYYEPTWKGNNSLTKVTEKSDKNKGCDTPANNTNSYGMSLESDKDGYCVWKKSDGMGGIKIGYQQSVEVKVRGKVTLNDAKEYTKSFVANSHYLQNQDFILKRSVPITVVGSLTMDGNSVSDNAVGTKQVDETKKLNYLRRGIIYIEPLPTTGVLSEDDRYEDGPSLDFYAIKDMCIKCRDGACNISCEQTDNDTKNDKYYSLSNTIDKDIGGQVIPMLDYPSVARYPFQDDGSISANAQNGFSLTSSGLSIKLKYPSKIAFRIFDSASDCAITLQNSSVGTKYITVVADNKWHFLENSNYIYNEYFVPDGVATYPISFLTTCGATVKVFIMPQIVASIEKSGFVEFKNFGNNDSSSNVYYQITNPGVVKLNDEVLKSSNFYETNAVVEKSVDNSHWAGGDAIYVRKGQMIMFNEKSWYNITASGSGFNITEKPVSLQYLVMTIKPRPALLCKGKMKEAFDNPNCNKGYYNDNGVTKSYCKYDFKTICPDSSVTDIAKINATAALPNGSGIGLGGKAVAGGIINNYNCEEGCFDLLNSTYSQNIDSGSHWTEKYKGRDPDYNNSNLVDHQIYFVDELDKKANDQTKANQCNTPQYTINQDNNNRYTYLLAMKDNNGNDKPITTYTSCSKCLERINNPSNNIKREPVRKVLDAIQCYDLEDYVGRVSNFDGTNATAIVGVSDSMYVDVDDVNGNGNTSEMVKDVNKYGGLSTNDYKLGAKKLGGQNNKSANYFTLEDMIVNESYKDEEGLYTSIIYSTKKDVSISSPSLVKFLALTHDNNLTFSDDNVSGTYAISYASLPVFENGNRVAVVVANANWDGLTESGIKRWIIKYNTDKSSDSYGNLIPNYGSNSYSFLSNGYLMGEGSGKMFRFDNISNVKDIEYGNLKLFFKVIDKRGITKGTCRNWQEPSVALQYSCDGISWSTEYPSQLIKTETVYDLDANGNMQNKPGQSGCNAADKNTYSKCKTKSMEIRENGCGKTGNEIICDMTASPCKERITTVDKASVFGDSKEQFISKEVEIDNAKVTKQKVNGNCPTADTGYILNESDSSGNNCVYRENDCPQKTGHTCIANQAPASAKWKYLQVSCPVKTGYTCATTGHTDTQWKYIVNTCPLDSGRDYKTISGKQYVCADASKQTGNLWVYYEKDCPVAGTLNGVNNSNLYKTMTNKCELDPDNNLKWKKTLYYTQMSKQVLEEFKEVAGTCRDIYENNSGTLNITMRSPRNYSSGAATGIAALDTNWASYLSAAATGAIMKFLINPTLEAFDGRSMYVMKTPASSKESPVTIPCNGGNSCVKYKASGWLLNCAKGDDLCYAINNKDNPSLLPCDDDTTNPTYKCKIFRYGVNAWGDECKKGTPNCVKICEATSVTDECGRYIQATNSDLAYDGTFGQSCSGTASGCVRKCPDSSMSSPESRSINCVKVNDNGGFSKRFYIKIINSVYYQTVLKICLVLSFTFLGLYHLLGFSAITHTELINRVTKIGFIYMFVGATGWSMYEKYFITLFRDGFDWVTFAMASAFDQTGDLAAAFNSGDLSDRSILFTSFDKNLGLMFSKEVTYKIFGLMFVSFFGWLYTTIIYSSIITYVFAGLNIVMAYIISQLFISVLLGFGPIFMVLLLFNKTKEMFSKWVGALVSAVCEQVMVVTVLAFFNSLVYMAIKNTLAFKVCYRPVIQVTLPLFGSFTIFTFWKASSSTSPGGVASSIPGLFRILLIYILTDLMKTLTSTASAIGSGIGGSGVNVSGAGGLGKGVTDLLDKAEASINAGAKGLGEKAAAGIGGALIGYKTDAQEAEEEKSNKTIREGINAANEAGIEARNAVLAKGGSNEEAAEAQKEKQQEVLKSSGALKAYAEKNNLNLDNPKDAQEAMNGLSKSKASQFTGRGQGLVDQGVRMGWRNWGKDRSTEELAQNTIDGNLDKHGFLGIGFSNSDIAEKRVGPNAKGSELKAAKKEIKEQQRERREDLSDKKSFINAVNDAGAGKGDAKSIEKFKKSNLYKKIKDDADFANDPKNKEIIEKWNKEHPDKKINTKLSSDVVESVAQKRNEKYDEMDKGYRHTFQVNEGEDFNGSKKSPKLFGRYKDTHLTDRQWRNEYMQDQHTRDDQKNIGYESGQRAVEETMSDYYSNHANIAALRAEMAKENK